MSVKYAVIDTVEDQLSYSISALKNMTIRSVQIGNDHLSSDQYTLTGIVFLITETDIKVETKTDNLIIAYEWVKRN